MVGTREGKKGGGGGGRDLRRGGRRAGEIAKLFPFWHNTLQLKSCKVRGEN